MPSSEPTPSPPPPPNLTAKKVPWGGARKPAATAPPVETAPPAVPPPPSSTPPPAATTPSSPPALTAKQVPWGGARKPAPTRPLEAPSPFAATPVEPPPVAPPSLTAKKIPWGGGLKTKKAAPPPKTPAKPSAWALPKTASPAPEGVPPDEAQMDTERDRQMREAESDRGPTAEELVAMLSKRASTRLHEERAPLERYKARPISFAATPWDVFKMRVQAHRWKASVASVALLLILGTAYVLRLASLDAALDRQLHTVETLLRQRYAVVPAYVACIQTFGNDERYTFAVTEKSLAAWRAARTEKEIAAASARMEQALNLLATVMNRYAQDGAAREPGEEESIVQFGHLEEQRKQSRALLIRNIQNYNQAVENFDAKVLGVPGSWVAWTARLQPRTPLYSADNR